MVVPEDPVLDQYVLKPIVEKLFVDLGRRARVQVLANPRLRGVSQASCSSAQNSSDFGSGWRPG